MHKITLILGFIIAMYSSVFAQQNTTNKSILLSSLDTIELLYNTKCCTFFDAKNPLNIQEAIANIQHFKLFDSLSATKKCNERWLYFTIINDFSYLNHLYLYTKHNDYVSLYAVKNGKVLQHFKSGFLEKNKVILKHGINATNYIEIPTNDTIQVFIKIANFLSYHYVEKIEVFNENYFRIFLNKIHYSHSLSSVFNPIFFGSIAFALFFVLFLFYYARSKIYLYYAIYLSSLLVFALPGLKGLPIFSEIFHLESNFYFYLYEPSLFLFTSIYGLFVLKILEINKSNYPKIYYFTTISSFIIFCYVVFLIAWIHFFRYPYRDIFNFVSTIYVQLSSFILLISVFFIESTYKKIVLIGMTIFFVLGMLAFVMDDIFKIKLYWFGYLVNYFLFLKLGILIEIIFFAMALGKRTYILEQEKLKHYSNYIQELEENSELQQKINLVKLESLRSQMNPHFIFNSLNAINYLVLKKDNENATIYIHQFSKFFRNILNNTRAETISLEDEVKMAVLYLDIEQKRLSNNFYYTITQAENINLSSLKIPSLLLQPFLENAIWHGLQQSDLEEKKIEISIYENKNKEIQLEIYDNGIGRIQAQSQKSYDQKKSHGLNITFERIQLHNVTSSCKLDFKIIDLPVEKNRIGTVIIFTFTNQ